MMNNLTPATKNALLLAWHDESATKEVAQALSKAGVENAVIELHGDLGAGKTTFARYLLQALGVQGHIKSPTYAIVEAYETGFPVWHLDFYRFNDPMEWEDAGFRDIFASPGLKLLEWPEKAQDLLPQADLKLTLTADALQQARQVQGHALTPEGEKILKNWSVLLNSTTILTTDTDN